MPEQDKTTALSGLLPATRLVRKVSARESRTCSQCGVEFQTRAEKQIHQEERECD